MRDRGKEGQVLGPIARDRDEPLAARALAQELDVGQVPVARLGFPSSLSIWSGEGN